MQYFFWFWFHVIKNASFIIRSRKRETKNAYNLLNAVEKDLGGQFNPKTKRKIAVSYGIYNPMICDTFTKLHGRLTNNLEKNRYIHYFICSSLFDDFTDYRLISDQQLHDLSFQPEQYICKTFDEKVFQQSHLLLRNFVKDKVSYDRISYELYHAQMQSRKQQGNKLSDEEIRLITFCKGGNSVLLCRYYLELPSDKTEEECWYIIGTLIQLTNDLYDIYKDLKDNISTLPNRMTNIYSFEIFFIERIQEIKKSILALPYSYQIKKGFSLSMAGIYAFGLIAIDNLKKIQGDNKQLPDLKTLPREMLVIDMEKISNLAKWFKFTYRYARIFNHKFP